MGEGCEEIFMQEELKVSVQVPKSLSQRHKQGPVGLLGVAIMARSANCQASQVPTVSLNPLSVPA